jgi:hypothetical protein
MTTSATGTRIRYPIDIDLTVHQRVVDESSSWDPDAAYVGPKPVAKAAAPAPAAAAPAPVVRNSSRDVGATFSGIVSLVLVLGLLAIVGAFIWKSFQEPVVTPQRELTADEISLKKEELRYADQKDKRHTEANVTTNETNKAAEVEIAKSGDNRDVEIAKTKGKRGPVALLPPISVGPHGGTLPPAIAPVSPVQGGGGKKEAFLQACRAHNGMLYSSWPGDSPQAIHCHAGSGAVPAGAQLIGKP